MDRLIYTLATDTIVEEEKFRILIDYYKLSILKSKQLGYTIHLYTDKNVNYIREELKKYLDKEPI